jgi:hypothetical protein
MARPSGIFCRLGFLVTLLLVRAVGWQHYALMGRPPRLAAFETFWHDSGAGPSAARPGGPAVIGPHSTGIHLVPTTRLGVCAVRLLVVSAAASVVGISLAAARQIIAGEGAFDSLWLTVPLTGAAQMTVFAGLIAGVLAAFAIVRRGERSVLAFLPTIFLVFFAIFLAGG